jgi:hypothetical protein
MNQKTEADQKDGRDWERVRRARAQGQATTSFM